MDRSADDVGRREIRVVGGRPLARIPDSSRRWPEVRWHWRAYASVCS